MNSTLATEIEMLVRATKQELDNITARVRKEMSQISTALKEESGEGRARYAGESKREADKVSYAYQSTKEEFHEFDPTYGSSREYSQ